MAQIHRKKPAYSTPQKKNSYKLYKDELWADFNKSCGYCDCPDTVWGGKAGFQIDHFAPQKKFPHLSCTYDNLIYACPICNRGKSNLWPSDDPSVSYLEDNGFINPCHTEYDDHLARAENGAIVALTPLGGYMAKTMKLGLARHQVIWLREELRFLIKEVKIYIDSSSELKGKYHELLEKYFEYDEQLRIVLDDR